MAQLKFQQGNKSWSIELTPGSYLLGRDAECEIQLDSDCASRRHCRLKIDSASAMIEDLQSSNGTFLNGKKIERANLAAGDLISIGEINIFYQAKSATKAKGKNNSPLLQLALRLPLRLKIGILILSSFLIFQYLIYQQTQQISKNALTSTAIRTAKQTVLYLAEKNRKNLDLGNFILLDTESIRGQVGVKKAILANQQLRVLSPLSEANLVLSDAQSIEAAHADSEEVFQSNLQSDGSLILAAPIRQFSEKEGLYQTIGVAQITFSTAEYLAAYYSAAESLLLSLLLSLGLAIVLTLVIARFLLRPLTKIRLQLENMEKVKGQRLDASQFSPEIVSLVDLINYRLLRERRRQSEESGQPADDKIQEEINQQLQASKETLKRLIKFSRLGVVYLDTSLMIEIINDQAIEILEISNPNLNKSLDKLLDETMAQQLLSLKDQLDQGHQQTISEQLQLGGTRQQWNLSASRNVLGLAISYLLTVELI